MQFNTILVIVELHKLILYLEHLQIRVLLLQLLLLEQPVVIE